MDIAEKYIEGLKKAYLERGGEKEWERLEKIAHGAANEDIEKLKAKYPDVPDSLVQLLEHIDGTYWRDYEDGQIHMFFLGSDLEEFPYYLLSVSEMIKVENFDWMKEWIQDFNSGDFEEFGFDGDEIDEKITKNTDHMQWLHFSNCMNNGGSSKIFIDFTPSDNGVKGQIVRYVHDSDELKVIADSFDEYLEMLMDSGYDFINEEDFED